jgi:hypothetical protein
MEGQGQKKITSPKYQNRNQFEKKCDWYVKPPKCWKKSKFGAFTNFWGLPTPNIWYPF